MTLLKSSTTITHEPRQRMIEILPSGVGDFPVLHFLLVFDFISHFYQLFLVSCLFVNSASCKQSGVSKWAGTRYFYPPEIVYSTGRNY